VRSAEKGDYPALRKELKAELDKGAFGAGDARDLARVVAKVDLAAKEKADVLTRVRALAACAGAVGEPLETLAERDDEIGAVATLALVEAKKLGRGSARSRAEAKLASVRDFKDAAMWRAVLSRALSTESDGDERRKRLLDGDDDVRVAALRAAGDALDARDVDLLLEAARVDPLPLARTLAVRSLGDLGGEKVTLALKDLWPRADEPLREAIVEAWSAPACFRAGGQRELELALAEGKGAPGVAAALALARLGSDDQKGAALGLLARTIDAAPSNQRVYAISASPLAPVLRAPLWSASRDDDELVAIAAVNRLLSELEQGHDDVLVPDPSEPVAAPKPAGDGAPRDGAQKGAGPTKDEPKKGPPTRKELVDAPLPVHVRIRHRRPSRQGVRSDLRRHPRRDHRPGPQGARRVRDPRQDGHGRRRRRDHHERRVDMPEIAPRDTIKEIGYTDSRWASTATPARSSPPSRSSRPTSRRA
jgi:hypothetical protein